MITHTIYNKACIEKKYTDMYSDLITALIKSESSILYNRYKDNPEEFNNDFNKVSETDEAKPKSKSSAKKNTCTQKFFKKRSIIKTEISNLCRNTIEILGSSLVISQDDPDKDEKLAKHKDKVIGNVRFIGSLFNHDIFVFTLMITIIKAYLIGPTLSKLENSDEPLDVNHLDLLEGACVLFRSIGAKMDDYIKTAK